MTDSIKVTCGQCQHFTPHNEQSDFGDNGHCAIWNQQKAKNQSIVANSQFFVRELGGSPVNNELLRQCNNFDGKYVFPVEQSA